MNQLYKSNYISIVFTISLLVTILVRPSWSFSYGCWIFTTYIFVYAISAYHH